MGCAFIVDSKRRLTMYLIELILGWFIGLRNGGEYYFMEDER